MDTTILLVLSAIGGFILGYGLRSYISYRRRHRFD
jgi:hypothetical protein